MITKTDWETIHTELIGELPPVETLLAYERGTLAAEEEDRVRRALAMHPDVAFALTVPFPEDDAKPGEDGYLPPAEIDRCWKELQRSIHGVKATNVVQFWQRATFATAAALVLAIAGLLVQGRIDAKRMRSELAKPRAAAEYVVLMPDGQRGKPAPPVPLAMNAESTMIVAPLIGPPSEDGYRLRIVDEAGSVLWTSGDLRLRDDDTFAILVPHAFLRPGDLKVVLYGLEGTREEELARYSMRVPRS